MLHPRLLPAVGGRLQNLGVRHYCRSYNQALHITNSQRNFTSKEEKTAKSTFPWRHNQYILPRVELEILSDKRNGWQARLAALAWEKGTMVLMRRPFHEIIGSSWRQNLADECAWAFTSGLAKLLSNNFKVPLHDILLGEGSDIEINFEYTTPYCMNENFPKGANEDLATDAKDLMFEKEYQLLFKKFYEESHHLDKNSTNMNPLEIKLSTKPITSDLVRLYAFPFLSRDAVKEVPSRKKDYLQLMPIANPGQGPADTGRKLFAFADQLILERGLMQTTVIAEVLVVCMETFYIKDLKTDEILQGHSTEQTVPHVLRMEMDIMLDVVNNEDEWFQSNWRIADIDDAVGERDWWTPRL